MTAILAIVLLIYLNVKILGVCYGIQLPNSSTNKTLNKISNYLRRFKVMTIITTILSVFQIVLIIAILTVIGSIVKLVLRFTKNEEEKKILQDVEMAVKAAEQQFSSGEDKRAYVDELLTKMGYEIDDLMSAIIEASVNRISSSTIFDNLSNITQTTSESNIEDTTVEG